MRIVYIVRYIFNTLCTQSFYEVWSKKKSKATNFKILGCLAYAHFSGKYRYKLETKRKKCIFIGYSTKSNAYKLYELVYRKTVINKDVIFDEEPPLMKNSKWKGEVLHIDMKNLHSKFLSHIGEEKQNKEEGKKASLELEGKE